MIDKSFSSETLKKLVQINSVNPDLESGGGGEQEVGEYIIGLLNDMGIEAELDQLAPGRVNVTGIIRGKGDGPSLMLNAHMDTVGITGMEYPFSAKIENGKLYGRGAYDMKGSIAAILAAAKKIREENIELNGDVLLSFVADEEYESIGAQDVIKKHKPDAAVVTEPTDLDVCLAHRGFGIYKITTEGKTAHGGQHRVGVDANRKMGLFLAELDKLADELPEKRKHPLCGEASMHVPLINGGRSLFIYSNECTINVERRTLPGETKGSVSGELELIIDKLQKSDPDFRASLETEMWRSPYEVAESAPIVEKTFAAASEVIGKNPRYIGHTWWEDSAIFGEAGIESVILGPKGGGIHEDVEWVELDAVAELGEILVRTAQRFCG